MGAPEPALPPFPAPPGYTLLAELGRGGAGIVWKARQHGLEREVALKVLASGMLASDTERARLRREAEAMARLRHPHIVAIHEVGEVEGYLFLAMEYLSGGTLANRLQAGPLDSRKAAILLHEAADALSHAHERGVIHRDLKPANILLDAMEAPHLADFGLAKLIPAAVPALGQLPTPFELTLSGHALGTVHYLAPEQAGNSPGQVGPAVDIHALGAVLYHCLTGRPPFLGESFADTLRQVTESEPPQVRTLNPGVPRDLETICLKCLRKDPAQRYGSAKALREDLDRFLKGLPVLARPITCAERTLRMARRHPIGTGLLLSLTLALVGWFLSLHVHLVRLEQAHGQLRERDALHSSEWVQLELSEGETVRALTRLARAVRDHPEARYLAQRLGALMNQRALLLPELQLGPETAGAIAVCIHPKGDLMAIATQAGKILSVQLYRLPSGQRVGDVWHPSGDSVGEFAFVSEGRALLLKTPRGPAQTRWLDPSTPPVEESWRFGDPLLSVDESFRLIVTNAHKPWVSTSLVQSSNPDQILKTFPGEEALPSGVWSPAGTPRRFVTSCRGGVRVHDGNDGALLMEAPDVGGIVLGAAWSPDARVLALCTLGMPVRLWRLNEPSSPVKAYEVSGIVRNLQWSKDGTRLIATTDGAATLLSGLPGAARVVSFPGWTRATFAHGSGDLYLGGKGGILGKVPASGSDPVELSAKLAGTPDRLDITADDRWLGVATVDQFVALVERSTGRLVSGPVPIHPSGRKASGLPRVLGLVFSPDGRSIAAASAQSVAGLWTVPDLKPLFSWHTNAPFTSVAFSPDGHWLALGSMLGSVWLVDAASGVPQRFLPHTEEVFHVGFSADGSRLVSTDAHGQVRVWRVSDGRLDLDLKSGFVQSQWAGFSAAGDTLAAIAFDGHVSWWDARNGQPAADSTREGLTSLLARGAFQPHGNLLAVGGHDQFWLIASPVTTEPLPGWIIDLAEGVAGARIRADGSVEALSPESLIGLRRNLAREIRSSSAWSTTAKRFMLP